MLTGRGKKSSNILVVEDNPADARILQEAFKECNIDSHMFVAKNGMEAIQFLRNEKNKNEFLPDLILLDLNMPLLGGREVLAEIKTDPVFRKIPVVVLSTSDAKEDIKAAYDLQANSYIIKPFTLDKYISLAKAINEYWLNTVRLLTKDNL